jgi:lipid II isoglutaminyl synthase (glutamine-hydrolysing)
MGVKPRALMEVLSNARPAFGRVERVELQGREVYLLLIKNPAGFSQVLDTFLSSEKGASVMFVINDLDADGRDVSWLWDVPLEIMSKVKPRVITAGIRGRDMTLRLHYAGVESTYEDNLGQALARLVEQTPEGGTAYVLPTYTAMLQVRRLLSKLTRMAEV